MAFGIGAWLLFVDRGPVAALAAGAGLHRPPGPGHERVCLHPDPRPDPARAAALLRPPEHLRALPLPRPRRAVPRPVQPARQPVRQLWRQMGRCVRGAEPPVHRSGLADGRHRRLDPGRARPARVPVHAAAGAAERHLLDELRRRRHRALLHAHRAGRRDHDRRRGQRRGGDRGPRHGRCQPPLLRLPGPPARGDRHRRAGAGRRRPAARGAACWPGIRSAPSRAPTATPTPGSNRSIARCRRTRW